jgi:MFS superfamily sulfate permease-like transporter
MWSFSAVVVQNSKEHNCKALLFGDSRHTLDSIAICSFQYGLYSAFVGCFVYVVFGSCKDITIGPTALMALMTYQQIIGRNVDFAILLCFLTGCVQLLMAVLHLGTYNLLSFFLHTL